MKKGTGGIKNKLFHLPASDLKKLRDGFKEYDQLHLISTLAGLTVCTETHAYMTRIEVALRIACSLKTGGNIKVKPSDLQNLLNEALPTIGDIGILEYPIEDSFTKNITFIDGDYIVFPGDTCGDDLILKSLLNTIISEDSELPTNFVAHANRIAIILLSLSNIIAHRLNYERYMDSRINFRQDVQLPGEDYCDLLRKAVIFSKNEIDNLLKRYGIDERLIEPFIIETGDDRFTNTDIFDNVMYYKPIVKIGDNYIVALPTSILRVIRHAILLLAKPFKCFEQLMDKYKHQISSELKDYFYHMDFRPIDCNLPKLDGKLPLLELTYCIDSDKIVYIQAIIDNGENYTYKIHDDWDLTEIYKNLSEREKKILNFFKKEVNADSKNILVIKVMCGVGRSIKFISCTDGSYRNLLMAKYELENLINLGNIDNLTLWKYSGSIDKILLSMGLISTSFLDSYSYYVHNIFNINKVKFDGSFKIRRLDGDGRVLRVKGTKIADIHSALKDAPPYHIIVKRATLDPLIPIYRPDGYGEDNLDRLIEGYPQAIWVIPNENIDETNQEVFSLIIDALCYWIWQFKPSLSNYTTSLGIEPIHIKVDFENIDDWINIPSSYKENANPNFKFAIIDRTILLRIPTGIQSQLARNDNFGERLIINALLDAFNGLLSSNNQEIIGDDVKKSMINLHAPLGMKKRCMITDFKTNGMIIPPKIADCMLIDNQDLAEQQRIINNLLTIDVPDFGISEKDKVNSICNAMYNQYKKRLLDNLKLFDYSSLIKYLTLNHEIIVYKRESAYFEIPYKLACDPYKDHVEELDNNIQELTKAAYSNRTLIEIMAAEPPTGTEFSMAGMDELLSLTYHMLYWSTISEFVHLDILKIKINKTDTGIIFATKANDNDPQELFYRAKTEEIIDTSISQFIETQKHQDKLNEKDNDNLNPLIEEAFESEFGVSATDLAIFFTCLISSCNSFICAEQKTEMLEVYSLPFSEFKKRLSTYLKWPEKIIDRVIDEFSLKPRESWDKPPKGFNDRDIQPWRYNRALSYSLRPIIISSNPTSDPIVYWGSRHVESSSLYLQELVLDGRYKGKSEKMKALRGKLIEKYGGTFTNIVKEWLIQNTRDMDWYIRPNVYIGPGKVLDASLDLGDIDILAIDKQNQIIYSIECKIVNSGRNPREIRNEMSRYIDDEDNDFRIAIHMERENWIKGNINQVEKLCGFRLIGYQVLSLVIISEQMQSIYLRETIIPFIPFTKLKKDGIEILKNIT